MKHILIVDDEEDICEILRFNIENEGFAVDTANSAEEALALDVSRYSLLLLDVMMGQMSGFKMADLLKKNSQTRHIPIIFLTAKTTENDTLTGFSVGADDYIAKPFSVKQVVARIKAVLKRCEGNVAEQPAFLNYEKMEINVSNKSVSIDGVTVELTKKEFEILHLLVCHEGQVFSREEILKRVWPDDVYVLARTVDVNITRLRKKIEPYSKNIATRLGFGYCWEV